MDHKTSASHHKISHPGKDRGKILLTAMTLVAFLAAGLLFALVDAPMPPTADAANPFGFALFLPDARNSATTDSAPRVSWGSPVAVSPADGSIWVVNPDAGSISAVDGQSLTKRVEIAVGGEPWSLAFAPDGGTLYVVDRAGGVLDVVDVQGLRVAATIAVGPEPAAVAVSGDGERVFVTVSAANTVAVIDAARRLVIAQVAVAPRPYGLATRDNQIYVTHLFALPRPGHAEMTDDGREGRITVLDTQSITASDAITRAIPLGPDAHGFPNLLSAVALNEQWAWVPAVRDAPALPTGLTTTVFSAVSVINRGKSREESAARLDLNDADIFGSTVNNPVAALPSPDGKTLYVVLAGSNLVEIIDISTPHAPRLVKFLPGGQNPRGMALSADGHWGYVMSYLSRSLTVLDLFQQRWLAEVTVTPETLDPALLRGKILFNNASDPRLSRQSWISCASCHPDGGSDTVTWAFPDGPRQTPALWNSGKTLPWHWSAALDEPQDVEETIQVIQQGLGLAHGIDPPLLGAPNAGRSADLDALARFVTEGVRAPHLRQPQGEVEVKLVARGRELFGSAGCAGCHGGGVWTSSKLPGRAGSLDADGDGMVDGVLRDVGTLNALDGRGASGFDVPSLLGVGLTAPYLHDGSMATLEAVLRSGHPEPGKGVVLGDGEVEALVAFLMSIDADTAPVAAR